MRKTKTKTINGRKEKQNTVKAEHGKEKGKRKRKKKVSKKGEKINEKDDDKNGQKTETN